MRTVVTLAALLLAAASCGDEGESTGGARRGSGANDPARAGVDSVAYPDNAEGLEQLVKDILVAIEKRKTGVADRLTRSLQLRNHQRWFAVTFGKSYGTTLAADYGSLVGRFAQMALLFDELLKNEQTQISAERFVDAEDPDLNGYQSLALAAMKKPTALYSVRLSKQGEKRGFHLWSFVHEGGSFRWVGKMKPLRKLSDKKPDWIAKLPADLDPLELRLRDAKPFKER